MKFPQGLLSMGSNDNRLTTILSRALLFALPKSICYRVEDIVKFGVRVNDIK